MNENRFRFVAIPTEFAAAVRAGGRGRTVVPVRDGARHQCRHCLTLSTPEETVLLASYSPFSADQPYAERGPVFVHQRDCGRYSREEEYPSEFPRRTAVLRAYDPEERQVASEVVGDRPVAEVIGRLLSDPRISHLHARNVAEGCFMFRIERAIDFKTV
jgi:hypothetical protein